MKTKQTPNKPVTLADVYMYELGEAEGKLQAQKDILEIIDNWYHNVFDYPDGSNVYAEMEISSDDIIELKQKIQALKQEGTTK